MGIFFNLVYYMETNLISQGIDQMLSALLSWETNSLEKSCFKRERILKLRRERETDLCFLVLLVTTYISKESHIEEEKAGGRRGETKFFFCFFFFFVNVKG